MSTLLSTQSRKAWIGGAAAALLQPILYLLMGQDVLTLRTLLVAVISGVLGAVAVWATDNVDAPAATPATPDPAPATAAELPMSVTDTTLHHAIPPVPPSYLQTQATEDFGGQTVHD